MRPKTPSPLLLVLAFTFILLPGCGKSPEGMDSRSAETASGSAADETSTQAGAPASDTLTSSSLTYSDAQRKFIRTAAASFRVKDVYKTALSIEDSTAAAGGFVVHNSIKSDIEQVEQKKGQAGTLIEYATYTVRGVLTVRVPTDKTQTFLRGLAGHVEFLDQRTFDALDAQFEVLRRQQEYLRNQEAQQDLAATAQQKGKIEEKTGVIEARTAMKSARDNAQVDRYELEDRIAFSTITLSLYQNRQLRRSELPDLEQKISRDGPGFMTRVADSLVSGWYGLIATSLFLLRLWPLWIFLTLVTAVVAGIRKKRRAA